MFRIGDFSKLSQVSVKTLRFYDEIGLLKPTYVARDTGYRYYAANLLSRLNRIVIFKELGFSLEEITLLLHENLSPAQVREALQDKRSELAYKIAQEQARLGQIESWLRQIEQEGSVPDYEIKIKEIPAQFVASVRDLLDSYDQADELFDEMARHLKKHSASGRSGSVWHGCAGQSKSIDCEAFITLNHPVPESRRVKVYEQPASLVASAIHQGSDDTIPQAYRTLRRWIKKNHYRIAGPTREIYWEGSVVQNHDFGITELQYPILKLQSVKTARS
jgi:DNA-binding transcriptional MerR regulator